MIHTMTTPKRQSPKRKRRVAAAAAAALSVCIFSVNYAITCYKGPDLPTIRGPEKLDIAQIGGALAIYGDYGSKTVELISLPNKDSQSISTMAGIAALSAPSLKGDFAYLAADDATLDLRVKRSDSKEISVVARPESIEARLSSVAISDDSQYIALRWKSRLTQTYAVEVYNAANNTCVQRVAVGVAASSLVWATSYRSMAFSDAEELVLCGVASGGVSRWKVPGIVFISESLQIVSYEEGQFLYRSTPTEPGVELILPGYYMGIYGISVDGAILYGGLPNEGATQRPTYDFMAGSHRAYTLKAALGGQFCTLVDDFVGYAAFAPHVIK